eukprot:MONOS_9762.1-p1 / transcript=MONOS_9762.1 / gene=MONOS_9762 / organism=Monocercomonoides_exilis_PA203 / gene_product=unspecified product / transcript_product=unspecified product / location=Mono_scaffold00415:51914-53366(-) / protein_length=400 / sequence_SO=supercontig / SO=protein_coding / is_pseudo=false
MIGAMDDMDREELNSVLMKELFNKINKMMEEEKISIGNSILLLKSVGYCRVLKYLYSTRFDESLLRERFEKMINDENEKKKEEKDEKLLDDLCECFLLLHENISREFASICARYLLKVALKREESDDIQSEVEMALLTLSKIDFEVNVEKELYLKEIKEIIKYQKEHHNLTRLAYQSAWQFFLHRLVSDGSLEEEIENELDFVKEATRELEELSNGVDWKKKEKTKKEKENIFVIERWCDAINKLIDVERSLNVEEYIKLIRCLVALCRAARGNEQEIMEGCMNAFQFMSFSETVGVGVFLKEGVVDLVSEEMKGQTWKDFSVSYCLRFFERLSNGLKRKTDYEDKEKERKETKRRMFEKMEEEGYEGFITSAYEIIPFMNESYFSHLPFLIEDYVVNL